MHDMPTPCVCGAIVDLLDMHPIKGALPDGGNLVCHGCLCKECEGDGLDADGEECPKCDGDGYKASPGPFPDDVI